MNATLDHISTNELLHDLSETNGDIAICEVALTQQVTRYGDGESVQERLDTNREIKAVIEAELARRREINP